MKPRSGIKNDLFAADHRRGSHEHLGPADVVIIRVRRRLMDAAIAGMLLPTGSDWAEATRARREAGRSR
jgi:hypothetical protein